MRLRDRLERIEQMIDRPRYCGGGPQVIRIKGGLDGVEPLHATIGGRSIECAPGETEDEFEDRAINLATEMQVGFVVFGGLAQR